MSVPMFREQLRRTLESELKARTQIGDQSTIITHSEGVSQTPYRRVADVSRFFKFIGGQGLEVVWEIAKDASELSTMSGMTIRFGVENLVKTRHELVSELFTGLMHTDASWSAMDAIIEERTTPDAIFRLGAKEWVIIEIGTTLGHPNPVYRTKFMKYMVTLNKLAETHPDWRIFFWIVVVSPHEVVTTFKLQGSVINELMLRFKIGLAMEDEMKRRKLMSCKSLSLNETERAIQGSILRLSQTPMMGNDQVVNEDSVQNAMNFEKNAEYMSTSMMFIFQEAAKLSTTKPAAALAMAKAYEEVEMKISTHGNTRTDKKAPIQVPLFEADLSADETVLKEYPMLKSKFLPDHIDHLWRSAYDSKEGRRDCFSQMPLEDELNSALTNGVPESGSDDRSKWHRVEVELGKYAEQLSLDGLQGKRYKDDDFKAVRRQFQSRGFSLLAPTDDIEKCIKIQPISSMEPNKYFGLIMPLVEEANNLIGNTGDGLDQVRQIFNTDVMVALCQLSAVASELSVSLRQHVTPTGWILKKILYYDIELLIKPTNSESHVFFVMRIRGRAVDQGAFRSMYFNDGWWYSDLLSINASRLENLIRCPVIYCSTLLHFRINVDRVDLQDVAINTSTGYSEKMAMLTLMIALEDKSSTEELALNVRYLIMQFAKGVDPISPPEPGPVIKKTPTLIRSRLAVYLYNQIKKYCFLQMSSLPIKTSRSELDPDHSADTFDSLLCPFTLHELKTLYDAVQCMYIAYAKNKDTTPEQNCDFSMIKKIVEYGANTSPDKDAVYRGAEDPKPGEFPGPHEFSPSFLSEGCDLLKMRFRSDYGSDWVSTTSDRIIEELIRSTHHESLATLKASADFDAADARVMMHLEEREQNNFSGLNRDQVTLAEKLLEIYRKSDSEVLPKEKWAEISSLIEMGKLKDAKGMGKGRFKRISKSCKCHEAVVRELRSDSSTRPLLIGDYESIFKTVYQTMGGVCCYLFKKNQHGGLREIYVLTFKSRLLQLLPEVAARVLCSMCSEEVLTHPEKKLQGYESHHASVSAASGRGMSNDVLHRTSSEDKSKWSQGMNVAAFTFMFARLLDPTLSSAIARVMHLFRNKKVLLPEGVMNLLTSNVPLTDESYEYLRRAFWEQKDTGVFTNIKGNIFLNTPTGMWQGILHYSSSLLHVIQTIHYKNICRLHFRAMDKKWMSLGNDSMGSFVIDTVVSSDDSATYASIVLPQGYSRETLRTADGLLDQMLKLEVTHSRFFMMVESPKSCISSKTVGEFNSIFSCAKTYVSPSIKKVLAAATIPENEDLESRQVVLCNMYKDMLEEGCSHAQIHMMEICNAFLHYSAFGLSTARIFPEWVKLIMTHPDPHLGFLLVDLQDCAGVFGYDFKKLLSLSATNVPLMPTAPALIQSGIEGHFNSGVVLTQGGRRRWLQLVDRVVDPGWEEYLESNPQVMYMERGLTKEEIMARLSAKACSKGVHDALKEGNSLTRVISSTVYLLARNVVTVKTLDVRLDGVSKDISLDSEKRSLMSLTQAQLGAKDMLTHRGMTNDHKSLFYPNHLLHENTAVALRTCRNNLLIRTVRYRKTKNKIEVRGSTSLFVVPLLTVLRWKWFQYPIKYSLTVLEHSWTHYKAIFAWLADSPHQTLESSPFSSHVRLFGFLQSVDKKGSRLNILCRRLRSFNPFDQVMELSLHNWYPEMRRLPTNKVMVFDPSIDQAMPMVKMSILSSVMSGLLFAPVQADITEYVKSLMGEISLSESELYAMSRSRKYSRLAVLYSVAMGLDPTVVSTCLLNSCRGVVKTYIMPQRWENQSWKGPGIIKIDTGRLSAQVFVMDSSIIAIAAKNTSGLSAEYPLLAEYLEADGFNWDPPRPLSEYTGIFPQLRTAATDWTCSRGGLYKMPDSVRLSLTKRGEQKSVKVPPNLLEHRFPMVLCEEFAFGATLDDNLRLVKQIERTGRPSIRVMCGIGEGQMTLMKYFGPRQPKISEDCRALFGDTTDTESILSCWVTGTPISTKVGYNILKRMGNDSTAVVADETLEGIDLEVLPFFIKESFRWRCVSRSKIQLDLYRFIDDLEDVEVEVPTYNKAMQDEVNKIANWFSEEAWGTSEPPPPEVTIDEPEVDDVNFDWAVEAEMEHDTPPPRIDSPQSPGDDDPDDFSSDETTKINVDSMALRAAPSFYMSHCFWDSVIDRLEGYKIWACIREGLTPSGDLLPVLRMVCSILDLKMPESPVVDFDSDDE